MNIMTTTWPTVATERGVQEAYCKSDFECEMELHGESMENAIIFDTYIDESWPNRVPSCAAIWTATRVYFPSGECCFRVDSVDIPTAIMERWSQPQSYSLVSGLAATS